jgi:hypothetical protein
MNSQLGSCLLFSSPKGCAGALGSYRVSSQSSLCCTVEHRILDALLLESVARALVHVPDRFCSSYHHHTLLFHHFNPLSSNYRWLLLFTQHSPRKQTLCPTHTNNFNLPIKFVLQLSSVYLSAGHLVFQYHQQHQVSLPMLLSSFFKLSKLKD